MSSTELEVLPSAASQPAAGSMPRTSLFHRFAANERGNVAMVFGLTTIVVVAMVGGAVDYGRWLSARNQTQSAIDSALLAAGRTSQTTYGDATAAVRAASAYYNQMKSTITIDDTITFQAINAATTFTAKGSAYVLTPFLSIVGIERLPVLQIGEASQAESTIAQGGNSGSNIEIGLMLDSTGSMAGQKIEDLKVAAKDLVDIVVWQDQSSYQSRVGIAPFSGAVNVGDYFTAVTNLSAAAVSHTETYQSGTSYTWQSTCYKSDGTIKGKCTSDPGTYATSSTPIYSERTVVDSPAKAKCVVERTGTNELTETAPGTGAWISSWNVVKNTNSLTCPERTSIVPLTSNKATLKATIDGLVAENYTGGALGTAWAWYLISPEWGNVFTGTSKPESYSRMSEMGPSGQPRLRKIAILMTDGEYNRYQDSSAVVSTVNNKAKSLCANMKAKGITVYTVGFDLGGSADAINVLSNCATDSTHFYNAANGDALKAAFRDIALKISALRLSH